MVSKTRLSLSWRRYATAESISRDWIYHVRSTGIQILPRKTYSSNSTGSAFYPSDSRTSPAGYRVITLCATAAQGEGDTFRSCDKNDSWLDDWYRLALPDSSLCQCFSNAIHLTAHTDNATRHRSSAPLWRGLSHCIFYSRYTLEALFESHWQDQHL